MENITENSKNKKTPAKRVRSKLVKFYLTPAEYEFLKVRMEVCNISNMSLYLREVALRDKIEVEDSDTNKAIAKELAAIGRNINQIAARVNATDSIYKEDVNELKRRTEEVWQLLQSIR